MKVSTTKKNRKIDRNKTEMTLSSVILLVLWQIIARKINNDIYLPTLDKIMSSLIEIVFSQDFYLDIIMTFNRCIFSFLIALVLAVILGFSSYTSTTFNNLLKPINTLISSIPTMVLVVLALIWFNKDLAPFIVGVAMVFPTLYENIYGALSTIDKDIVEMLDIYKVGIRNRVVKVYIPAIKFRLSPILLSSFSLALKVVIAGEVHGQPVYGIGSSIQVAKMNFDTTAIFAWIIIILLISFALDIFQKLLVKKVFKWKRI